MLRFKEFYNTIIIEALNDKQKTEVNKWSRGDHSFSDHVFGSEYRTNIPLVS